MANSNIRHLYTDTIDGVIANKNYVRNAYARENISGWATYANTAQPTPVTGSGGSPTITLTRNTSSPIANEADFLITKGAANDQGQGISYDFIIDPADKNKSINVSFDYLAGGSFVPGSNSDLQVFIYDITSTSLIPSANLILSTSSGKFSTNFVSTTDTSYRLIMHIATTNASAWTLEFTNVKVTSGQPVTNATGTMPFFASSQITTNSTAVTSTSFANFSNSPSFTFTPTVSGTYKVYSSIPLENQNNVNNAVARIFNTSGGATLLYESRITSYTFSSNFGESNGLAESVYQLTAGTSYVFDIQGAVLSGGQASCNGSDAPFYMFAEGLSITVPVVSPGFQFFASSAIASSADITGSAFATFSSSPAFTFIPSITGNYKIYGDIPLFQGTSSIQSYLQIINTSGGGTLLFNQVGSMFAFTASLLQSVHTQSIYTLTAGNSYVFDIQGRNSSTGTLSVDAAGGVTSYLFAEKVG